MTALEKRCCQALIDARLDDYIDIDEFDLTLRSVIKLVQRERAAARRRAKNE